MRILKKAPPIWGAFLFLWLYGFQAHAVCLAPVPGKGESVTISHVYDGDTVLLTDGRRVRFAGMNTPETGKKGRRSEPYAAQAKRRLSAIVKHADLRFLPGQKTTDHYQRTLGYLFAHDRLVSELLVEEGLAFWIAIPPNTRYLDCLMAAEKRAKEAQRGLWSLRGTVRKVKSLRHSEAGFRLLTGRVSKVKPVRSGTLVEVDDTLAIMIGRGAEKLFTGANWQQRLSGQRIEIRGWIKPKANKAPAFYKPWSMRLTHPAQIRVLR